MPTESKIQQFVHNLEEGGWAKWVKLAVLLAAVSFMVGLWFFDLTLPLIGKGPNGFKGLANEKAIEQAQIAREIARGHGFSTLMIRPAAIWQYEKNTGSFPLEHTPDTYHAPLHPFINAMVFKATDGINETLRSMSKKRESIARYVYEEQMTKKQIIYVYDRIIAAVQLVFFLLAVLVSYFTAKRLFDSRLALLAVGLLLLCEKFWDLSMSGLPQMLMLFLFSCCGYTLVRAIEAHYLSRPPLPWLAASGAFFGLLALTHALTIWMFVGALLFSAILFRPRGRDAAVMLGVFLLCYSPWLVRNYQICGTPVGLGWYAGLTGLRGSENKVMRSMEVPFQGVTPLVFRSKVESETLFQLATLYDLLGKVLVAPVFFVALLHAFKRPETANFRWCIALMWLLTVFGTSILGISSVGASNDLHVLFIPLMTFYGLAFLLVMWTRLEIKVRLFRFGFFAVVFLVSALPFLNNFFVLIGSPRGRVQWPPYLPPYIAILGEWTIANEIIASDMPWAVAWYADRKSLWLPMTVKDLLDLNDNNRLEGRIVGLHLTPVSGNQPFVSEVVKGDYKSWAPLIMRTFNPRDFFLKAVTPLPFEGECIYYSDRDRWTNRED